MPGYLDQYGAGVERRLRIVKIGVVSALALVVAAGILFFVFRNHRQQQQVKQFLEFLANRDYQAAYALWARTEQDRRGYPMEFFLRDWGPQSSHADVSGYRIADSRSCGSGVVVTVDFKNGSERLWVERDTSTIGYSPPVQMPRYRWQPGCRVSP